MKHGVGNPKDRDAVVADIKAALPIMERIDCPSMIVMSGNVVPGMPRNEQHQSCIDGLKAMAAVVEGKKIAGQPVKLLLENIDPEENPKYYLTSVAEGFEIVKKVSHPQVEFLYDFFHEQISEGNLIKKIRTEPPARRHRPHSRRARPPRARHRRNQLREHLPQVERAELPWHGSDGVPSYQRPCGQAARSSRNGAEDALGTDETFGLPG